MATYPKPSAMVDIALFTLKDDQLSVMLARRDREPFGGSLSLTGGYIHVDEDVDADAAAVRILRTKVGIQAPYLEQLKTFSGKFRDPRDWSICIAYYAVVPERLLPSQAPGIEIVPVDKVPRLPFDHGEIVDTAVARLRGKSSYSSLPSFLLPETFTFNELLAVYRKVMGVDLDKVTFRRKIEAQGMVVPVEGAIRGGAAGRPAQLYRSANPGALKEFADAL